MPRWLTESLVLQANLTRKDVLIRLVLSLLFGVCVAAIFRWSHGKTKQDSATLSATLVLLSVLIAMVSMVIGDSVARAFSLVGALSIVRFRTVVEDTRDTAFVIFSVIVGMAAGAGLVLVPLFGIPLVGLVAMGMSRSGSLLTAPANAPCQLTVRLGLGRDPQLVLGSTLDRHLSRYEIVSAGTARQGAAVEFTYAGNLRSIDSLPKLVTELNQIEGVLSVELRT